MGLSELSLECAKTHGWSVVCILRLSTAYISLTPSFPGLIDVSNEMPSRLQATPVLGGSYVLTTMAPLPLRRERGAFAWEGGVPIELHFYPLWKHLTFHFFQWFLYLLCLYLARLVSGSC